MLSGICFAAHVFVGQMMSSRTCDGIRSPTYFRALGTCCQLREESCLHFLRVCIYSQLPRFASPPSSAGCHIQKINKNLFNERNQYFTKFSFFNTFTRALLYLIVTQHLEISLRKDIILQNTFRIVDEHLA